MKSFAKSVACVAAVMGLVACASNEGVGDANDGTTRYDDVKVTTDASGHTTISKDGEVLDTPASIMTDGADIAPSQFSLICSPNCPKSKGTSECCGHCDCGGSGCVCNGCTSC